MHFQMTANADYRRQRFLDDAEYARLIARAPRNPGSRRVLSPAAVRSAVASLVAAAVLLSMTIA